MQYISSPEGDNLCRSLPVRTSRPLSPGYSLLAFVMFLVLLLSGLPACGESFASTCPGSQAAILSVCMPPSHPKHTHVAMHTHTKTKKLKPTPGPFPPPTPTSSPTPSPTPIVVTPGLIMKTATHYLDLVLEGRNQEAYALLSAAARAQEPFDDFVKNPNYTLSSGCWKIVKIMATPLNSQRGIANVQLTQVSCSDDSPIAYYDWVISLQLQQDHLVIISIGLYPAAPASQLTNDPHL
jgi:hypothetical protein